MLQVSCPSLVGREDETTVLVAALDRGVSGAGSFVWVSGEAGVGKSRLVRELCDAAAGRGLPVLVGRAVDTRTPVPFRPLFEALSGHVRRLGADGAPSVDRRALAQIVPEWRGVAEEPYQASAMEIGEGLLRFLTSIPGDACMLVLEDLHWSDPDTAAVVEYLADNLTNAPVLCVVTTRLEGSDQVGRVLSDLAARRSAARMELRRLSTDELATMASTCLGAGVDASVMSLISDFADGLPLLVEELLTTSVADGTITSTGDGWRVEAAGGPAVPERFAELVRRRTGELDDDAGRAIRVGAVLGQRFDTELLRAALGVPTETVAQALRAGVQAQLVMADRSEPTAFEFRHALTREAILEEMLPLERIEIAREALAALEQDRPDLGDAFGEQAATLAEEAGDTERAAALLLRAARRARRRGALSSAVPMLDRAWSFVNDVEPEWFEIGDALLSVLGTTGAVDQALAVGQRMLAAAGPAQRVNIHLAMARAAAEASRWDTAGEHAAAAHDLVDDAPGTHLGARIDAVRAEVAVGQGRFDDAALLARTAMEVAEEREDCELEAATALVVGRCERGRGEGNPAATFDRVVSIGREHGLPAWQLRGLMERSSLALWEFEPPQGILAAREHATNAGALVVVAHLDNFLAWQAHDRRNTDQIEPAANRCIDLAKRLRLRTLHGVATVALAVAAAHHGDRERMERLLAEADAISDGHADVVALGGVARATYWIDRDDLRHAGTALEQMMDRLRVAPAVACPERGIWVLFEALDGDEAGTAAIDELDAYVGPNHVMIDSYRSYARAVVAGRRGAVDEANREVTLAERVQPAPWFQHHARRLVAETAHADGWGDPITWLRDAFSYFETRGDDRLASSCRSLLGALGSALPRQRRSDERVPPRLRALGVSAREADVLELLAEARSTRSIAETLHVSPKTVERHIANLATKLGVEGRTAVVAFAGAFGTRYRRLTGFSDNGGDAVLEWGLPRCATSWVRRTMSPPETSGTATQRRDTTMQVIAIHDVDDVQHWFDSPARSEFFEARGMKATAFRDPAGNATTVAVLIEAPDLDSLQAALATPEAKVTEEHDGVHVDTIKLFLGRVMAMQTYETAIATFRQVLAGVNADQLGSATPCASFDVAQLIDHTIGTQHMVTDALQDKPFNMTGVEVPHSEQAGAFDRAASDAVAELRRDGAMDTTVTLPFGSFSGEKLMGLAALDTFQHAWDLAKATGQDTDLDADLAESLMELAVAHMAHVPRGEEPAPYGPEQTAPEGAPAADRLAAFLGRVV